MKFSRETSQKLGNLGQLVVVIAVLIPLGIGLAIDFYMTMRIVMAAAILFYAFFVGAKVVLWGASVRYRAPQYGPLPSMHDKNLPTYTIFVPLYKEANMLPSLVRAIEALEYPKDKLQVLLLLEARDPETVGAARAMALPAYFEILEVPDVKPYGKPKALNMGLERATGELCVIFDAEDRPDPDQLLKAAATFRVTPKDVACLQARLYFWNRRTNLMTRFYWMEYIVHFEWVLPGFAKLGLIPPLGGTSNHFRTAVLRRVAFDKAQLPEGAEGIGGWDPWNVTEDAELAGALALFGYRVLTFDSMTREEATAQVKIADGQRRRWLKGYLQTGIATTRRPIDSIRRIGFVRWFCYVLLMLGTPVSLVLNPVFWGMTIIYFVTRTHVIEQMYTPPIFYLGVVLMLVGNLVLIFQFVVLCNKHGAEEDVPFLFLAPLWWLFTSWSMYNVLVEMAIPSKRHVWHKTAHGHDLHKEESSTNEESVESDIPSDEVPSDIAFVH